MWPIGKSKPVSRVEQSVVVKANPEKVDYDRQGLGMHTRDLGPVENGHCELSGSHVKRSLRCRIKTPVYGIRGLDVRITTLGDPRTTSASCRDHVNNAHGSLRRKTTYEVLDRIVRHHLMSCN